MFFVKASFLRGVIQSLESFRSSQIGTLGMGMFIWSESDALYQISSNLDLMSSLNDAAGLIIPKLAITAPWLVGPYLDMHTAVN